MTAVDIVLHLDVSDQEPGEPQTEASLREWLIPDLLRAVGRLLGNPGDYDAVWAGNPRYPEYEVVFPDCFHDHCDGPDEIGHYLCRSCAAEVTADGKAA